MFRMKKVEMKANVISFVGVLEVVHTLPGRMRLRLPSLKGREKGMMEFAANLKRLEGIESVAVNPLLGTSCLLF